MKKIKTSKIGRKIEKTPDRQKSSNRIHNNHEEPLASLSKINTRQNSSETPQKYELDEQIKLLESHLGSSMQSIDVYDLKKELGLKDGATAEILQKKQK